MTVGDGPTPPVSAGTTSTRRNRPRAPGGVVIAALACRELPLLPLWSGTQSYLVRDSVKSATGDLQRPVDGDLSIRELFVTR